MFEQWIYACIFFSQCTFNQSSLVNGGRNQADLQAFKVPICSLSIFIVDDSLLFIA